MHQHQLSATPVTQISPERSTHREKIAEITSILTQLNTAVEDLVLADAPSLDSSVDFYREVQLFETKLIKAALRVTGGSQVKAARLLKLKTTTLSNKIKVFNIAPARD
jgi:DNA-binding NtrC family response regulator